MSEDFKNPVVTEDDDAFIIGKGFQLETEEPEKKKHKRKKKEKKGSGVVKSIIWIMSIVIISAGLAYGIIYAGADYMGIGFGRGKDVELEIKSGASATEVSEQLETVGAVKIPELFRLYAKMMKFDSQFKYGVYVFNTEAGYEELCNMLITEGAKAETKEVKIPEFATIDEIAKILDKKGVCKKEDFYDVIKNGDFKFDFLEEIPVEKVHYRLEGYLFPETYNFYSYDSKECAYLAVKKMLETLDSKITPEMREVILDSGYSFHEIITMASIVESESANGSAEERAKVARVFYNRLEGVNWEGPKFLQTDPSTYYPYGNKRYNTYETEGLPPGPIGAPSINSIKAAIYPAENFDKTYFVTDKNANFYFNDTLAAHDKTIADLKAKGLWLYTQLGS